MTRAGQTDQDGPGSVRWAAVQSEAWLGNLNVGSVEGRGVEVMEMMEMMQRWSLEVLYVQEIKWKGDRVRRLVGGYRLLHMGRDGRSNGVETNI